MTREKADFSGEGRKGAGSPARKRRGEQEQPTTPPAHGTTTSSSSSRFLSLVVVVVRTYSETLSTLSFRTSTSLPSLSHRLPSESSTKKTLIPLPIMTLISRSAYRLSRRAGQQAKQAQRVAGLSTAAKVAQQVPAMLRADNRVSRTLPKAKEGECNGRSHRRTDTRRGETRDRRASKSFGNDGNSRRWRGNGSASRSMDGGSAEGQEERETVPGNLVVLVVFYLPSLSSPWPESTPDRDRNLDPSSPPPHRTRLAFLFLSP